MEAWVLKLGTKSKQTVNVVIQKDLVVKVSNQIKYSLQACRSFCG